MKSLGETAAASYQESYRDNVIENWQSHIRKVPECAGFAEKYAVEGKKHPSAASGRFMTAMQKVKAAAVQADCVVR